MGTLPSGVYEIEAKSQQSYAGSGDIIISFTAVIVMLIISPDRYFIEGLFQKPLAVVQNHGHAEMTSSSAVTSGASGPCGSAMETTTVWMGATRRLAAAVRMAE